MREIDFNLPENYSMTLERDNSLTDELEPAFSKKTRDQIVLRDSGRSRLSGSDVNLEAGHISHDKSSPNYDSPSNGRLVTLFEHLMDHINRAGRNGLTESQNNWAISKIKQRMYEKYHKDGDVT